MTAASTFQKGNRRKSQSVLRARKQGFSDNISRLLHLSYYEEL
jgi:hypothetical protein